jgi:hypothetical protein
MLTESKFSTVEDDITKQKFTKQIKQWITSFRDQNLQGRGRLTNATRAEAVKDLKDRLHKEKKFLLGQFYLGRKRIDVWIQDIPDRASWHQMYKRSSYIIIGLNLIIDNPDLALSSLVHEILHANQEYKKQSPEYDEAASKLSGETEEDWFYYYTEPKELEAQLGELGHNIVSYFKKKRDKQEILNLLDEVLTMPREKFADINWVHDMSQPRYAYDIFKNNTFFLKSISKPPASMSDKLKANQTIDRCWRQFKLKMFSLVQALKESL